jgi:hypothetical protein
LVSQDGHEGGHFPPFKKVDFFVVEWTSLHVWGVCILESIIIPPVSRKVAKLSTF